MEIGKKVKLPALKCGGSPLRECFAVGKRSGEKGNSLDPGYIINILAIFGLFIQGLRSRRFLFQELGLNKYFGNGRTTNGRYRDLTGSGWSIFLTPL